MAKKPNKETPEQILISRGITPTMITLEQTIDSLAKEGHALIEAEMKGANKLMKAIEKLDDKVPEVKKPESVVKQPVSSNNPYLKARTQLLEKMSEWQRNRINRIGKDRLNNVPLNPADERLWNEFSTNVLRLGNNL